MSRYRRHLLAAGAACALALAGCGGSDEPEGAKLPKSTVDQLNVRLDEIQRRFDAAQEDNLPGACEDIQNDSFPAVKRLIDGLPEDVDGQLRDATEESFARLQQLVDDGCQDITPTETETTPTETVPPETVPPETTPPETTPTETTPPETTPEKPPPGNKGSGNGNGNGNGGGNNGGTDPDGTGGGCTQAPQGEG